MIEVAIAIISLPHLKVMTPPMTANIAAKRIIVQGALANKPATTNELQRRTPTEPPATMPTTPTANQIAFWTMLVTKMQARIATANTTY